jgi:hypothetical protein
MIRFAADEDFDNDIIRALKRRLPAIDVTRVQDAGFSGANDAAVLEWAAGEGRVLLTHDASTMSFHALARLQAGHAMPGVIVGHQRLPIGDVIEDLVLIAMCSTPEEWVSRVYFLPLR